MQHKVKMEAVNQSSRDVVSKIGKKEKNVKRKLVPKAGKVALSTTLVREKADVKENNGSKAEYDQLVRDGHFETDLVRRQASKDDAEQPLIADRLESFSPSRGAADVCIVGCGPAGLSLAAELATRGISVALVGRDQPFVNNYGVWTDEFKELGLDHTLDARWDDAICHFGESKEVRVGRSYGRVSRAKLRSQLLKNCKKAGVEFLAGEVESISCTEGASASCITLSDGTVLHSRLVTLAAGAAAGKFMQFEDGAPSVASQTAYGMEVEIEGYGEAYDESSMLFMDFRRHHTGVWSKAGNRLKDHEHPAAGAGLWGTEHEVPSFLYAMPSTTGHVFLEETCLVAKPALPFATLKRRLHRRLDAMGIKVKRVIEEEWSYIPVGGPLPLGCQPVTAFGAAANLIHPATGYSIVRSLREAPELAQSMSVILRKNMPVAETSRQVWNALWPQEKRKQAAFHVFGMELLATLDLKDTNAFFDTFFRLPDFFWRGFLSSSLSSTQLIAFAVVTYIVAPFGIKWALMKHMITSPAGRYLLRAYTGVGQGDASTTDQDVQKTSSGVYITPAR